MTQTSSEHKIRAIGDDDLEQVVALLTEGFPSRTPAYWRAGLGRLAARDLPAGTEKYGYVIDADGTLQAVVLAISSHHQPDHVMVNISSWYARPDFRGPPAKELYRHASRRDDVTYTNLSAVAHTIKTITQFGFREWTAGQTVAVSLRRGPETTRSDRVLSPREAARAGLTPEEVAVLEDHERLGCLSICLETSTGLVPLVFVRRRVKRVVPAAQLIYCPTLEALVDHGRQVWKWLAIRGFPLLLVDTSAPVPGLTGRYVSSKASKYVKGPLPANVVDHTYSEMVLLGF